MRNAIAAMACGAVLWTSAPLSAATTRPVPAEQWTPLARLWLARALVGEAGWRAHKDHAGISWVLAKRWRARRDNAEPDLMFHDYIRRYAVPVHPDKFQRSWVLCLPEDPDEQPCASWGEVGGPWEPYARWWARVLQFTDAWAAGEVRDPFPSARHYGGHMDKPKGPPVSNGSTRNIFYASGGA